MGLSAHMLDDESLRATEDGFELDVYLNWYRALPLSSVKTVELTIDGETIAREDITFVVNEQEYALDDLPNHWDEYWFVLDPGTLRVRSGRRMQAGQQAEVTVRLGNRIPYILIGPETPLEYVSERSKALVAR